MSNPPGKRPEKDYNMTTRLIHGRDFSAHWEYRHHVVPPITASSTFKLDSNKRGAKGFADYDRAGRDTRQEPPIFLYDRLEEPTTGMLEEHLATAEEGEFALCFSSGMGAISSTFLFLARQGDEFLAHKTIYGCTYSVMTRWLPRLGVTTQFIDMTKLDEIAKSITPKTRMIYLESPANPTLDIVDIRAIASMVKELNGKRPESQRIFVVVDNTFATPYCQRPLKLGADIVVHSLTKNICGFGTDMGGALVVADQRFNGDLRMVRKDFGAVLSPRSAWNILVYGIGTLAMRVQQQIDNAMQVGTFLEKHPKVARVLYPGLQSFPQHELARQQMRSPDGDFAPGTVLYFELHGSGKELLAKAENFIDTIARESYVLTLAVSLGQIRTLIESPGLMTHSAIPEEEQKKAGFSAAGIRLSMGVERAADIIGDLGRALDTI